ncbi:oligopeptide/dipeptide ABC transporter ATP-binding protein [Sedimentibacter sp. zth1]|uniref:oligopeptide/dipeptide ABC transporter ATP-binding protein n=1 Tax=Sedimentibacter sp. zth1 TaxID=2816908 RepID=UPI0035303395
MKIGKQLTEAMILNGKSNQRTSKKEFDYKMNLLKHNMRAAGVNGIDEKINEFNKFSKESNVLERKYNLAFNNANNASDEIEDLLIDIVNGVPKEIKEQIKYLLPLLKNSINDYVVEEGFSKYTSLIQSLEESAKSYTDIKQSQSIVKTLTEIKEILDEKVSLVKPDFFSMGYYITHKDNANVKVKDIKALNIEMRDFLDANFMKDFVNVAEKGVEYSYKKAFEGKKAAIKVLEDNLDVFEVEELHKDKCMEASKKMIAAVNESIDRLAILKDSKAYTFNTSLNYEINSYFNGIPSNKKNLNKFEKETEKVKKLAAKGKETHKVTPAVIVDLELVKSNIKKIIISLLDAYKDTVEKNQSVDFNKLTLDMIEYLGEKASAIAYRVTNTMAKNKAIKLMKEVGIAKARERYYQYPFEFSGGMRQRIVIAIALAANPDILICDEPTTALDVTIQAQILELINNLKKERELSVIFITHDLGVVANMADKIAVMYAGKVVELGTADEIFYEPAHPYTWALLASMPDLETKEKLDAIPGTPPNMVIPPVGDAFAARNKYAMQIDFEQQPPMFEISPTHKAATWLLHPNAPKVKPPKIVSDRIAKMKNINSMEVSSDEQ